MRLEKPALRSLYPGYFILVMATGIVSTAASLFGYALLSDALLLLAALAYLLPVVLFVLRLFRFPDAFCQDLRDAGKAFGFFTFVAGSEVLAVRLVLAGSVLPSTLLAATGAAAWLVASYGIPAALMLRTAKGGAVRAVNGSWFLWVVGPQSVVTALCALVPSLPGLAAVAVPLAAGLWSFAAPLYVLLAAMVRGRLLFLPVTAGELAPPYWITVGATAISVLAGARILGLPDMPLLALLRPVVAGGTFLLWAFGSWWIPLLVGFGVWRHLLAREPFRYEPGLWSMVFPLGMYATASATFGQVVHLGFLVRIGAVSFWFALAAWLVVFAAMWLAWLEPAGRARP